MLQEEAGNDHADANLALGFPNEQERIADVLVRSAIIVYRALVHVLGNDVDKADYVCLQYLSSHHTRKQ